MDEFEFRRLLHLFPVVRSRDFHAETDLSGESASKSPKCEVGGWQDAWNKDRENSKIEGELDLHDAFWKKLKLAAEKKVGEEEAEKFCSSFQQIHSRLVNEELDLDAARSFLEAFSSVD